MSNMDYDDPVGSMDHIFQSVGGKGNERPDDDVDEYEHKVKQLIADAREYDQNTRSLVREEHMKYYMGLEPGLNEEGRSTIVITDVRDTILAIMPSLMRIFTAQDHIVEFVPTYEAAEPKASEQTDYIHWAVMDDNDGFMMLYSLMKDLLTKGEGIAYWYTDTTPEMSEQEFRGITLEQAKAIAIEPGNEILESKVIRTDPAQPPSPQNPEGTPPVQYLDVRVRTTSNMEPRLRVRAIPPDEFRIDRLAKSETDNAIIGWERVERPSELVLKGYDLETIEEYKGSDFISGRWNEERILRNSGLSDYTLATDANDSILFGEYFIRIDKDGDGIDELRYICTMGESDDIVQDIIVPSVNFRLFHCDPEPHTAFGHSITELVKDIQRIKTNITRNSLDSMAQTIYPRLKYVENLVNTDDVLNTELGAPIRTKDIGAVEQLAHTFLGDAPMQFLQYLDLVLSKRTGISDASKGLDPKALQSTTMKGVDMVITGAQERIELIARVVAETGLKGMFRGLLRESCRNPAPQRTIKVRGKWVNVDPSTFDPAMSVRVNPAIGRGSDMDRMAILSQVKATQETILQQMGPDNPLVSPIEYRATLQDILAIAGIKNVSRYFKDIDEQKLSAFMAEKAKNQPPNPAVILAQNETEKTRASVVKSVADDNFRYRKLEIDDNFRRDQLAAKGLMDEQRTDKELNHKQRSQITGHIVDLSKQSAQMAHEHGEQVRDHEQTLEQQDNEPEPAPAAE